MLHQPAPWLSPFYPSCPCLSCLLASSLCLPLTCLYLFSPEPFADLYLLFFMSLFSVCLSFVFPPYISQGGKITMYIPLWHTLSIYPTSDAHLDTYSQCILSLDLCHLSSIMYTLCLIYILLTHNFLKTIYKFIKWGRMGSIKFTWHNLVALYLCWLTIKNWVNFLLLLRLINI